MIQQLQRAGLAECCLPSLESGDFHGKTLVFSRSGAAAWHWHAAKGVGWSCVFLLYL